MPAKLKGLQKQVQETANRQEHSEDNFQCHIKELEEEVRLNIENKQLKATLGALEEKVEERDSERVEIEATPALEKELKESCPEMENVDVTLRGQPTEMEGVGTDVAAIMNTPQRSCALCYGPYLARRWEQWKIDSYCKIEKHIKALKEAAGLKRKHKERYKELMKKLEANCERLMQMWNKRWKKRIRGFTRRSQKLTHKIFSNIFNWIKSSIIPKLFFYIVSSIIIIIIVFFP